MGHSRWRGVKMKNKELGSCNVMLVQGGWNQTILVIFWRLSDQGYTEKAEEKSGCSNRVCS